MIGNDWTDMGYIIGFAAILGFFFHWSNFIIAGFATLLTILMKKKQEKEKEKKE